MPHQVEGVRWLFAAVGRGGGLLTDEPGLGKTLQVIALLEALVRAGRVTRVLIVAPANLCAHQALQPGPPTRAIALASPAHRAPSPSPWWPPCTSWPRRTAAARRTDTPRRVANWENEFHRWLGSTSLELSVSKVAKVAANLAATVQLQELVGTTPPHHKVLICGYEALYRHGRTLCTGEGVDLLVADEAHVLV